MKTKCLLFISVFLGVVFFGCSSSEDYYELNDEEKLQYTKDLIISYGAKYGLTNIQFDDELLRKNLNLPKEEFERSVIKMAISMGKIEPNSKFMRMTRTGGFGENEPIVGQPTLYVEGTVDQSHQKNNLLYKFAIRYYFECRGMRIIEVVNNQAHVFRLENYGGVTHEVDLGKYATCSTQMTSPIYLGPITFEPGATVELTIPYVVRLLSADPEIYIDKTVSGNFNVTTIVKSF